MQLPSNTSVRYPLTNRDQQSPNTVIIDYYQVSNICTIYTWYSHDAHMIFTWSTHTHTTLLMLLIGCMHTWCIPKTCDTHMIYTPCHMIVHWTITSSLAFSVLLRQHETLQSPLFLRWVGSNPSLPTREWMVLVWVCEFCLFGSLSCRHAWRSLALMLSGQNNN